MVIQFIPHGHCYLWKTNLVGLHLIADLIIALSYYSIPLTLFYFVRKRKDLPYALIFILFGAFIISCGTVHVVNIWTLWHPNYWFAGLVKAVTALVSFYTAIAMIEVVPQALSLPSHDELKQVNDSLELEIKERKQIEAVLEQEKAFIKALLNSLSDAIIACDSKGKVSLCNQAFLGLYGNPVYGSSLETVREEHNLYHLDGETLLEPKEVPLYRAFRGETLRNLEVLVKQEQNKPINLSINGNPIVDNRDRKIGAVIAIRDITKRKWIERYLRESEERFRLAFEDAATGMAIINLQGLFIQVNQALCEILGYSATELADLDSHAITHPDDLNTSLENYRQLISGEIDSFQTSTRYIHHSGKTVWASKSFSLVRDNQGQPEYFIAQIQDITEQKTAEIELAKSLQDKEVMLQEIHHRVKNNLQVICSLLNLQSRYLKETKTIKAFKETQNRVKSMALVHEQLYQSTNLSEIILSSYIKQLTDNLFRAYSIGSKIECNLQVADFNLDLDTAVPCGLIINEIITNAIKYAFHPGERGQISIQASSDDEDSLILSIADNGIGLKPDSHKSCKSLGLQLVKNLTEQLQGQYEITTEPDTGTKFTFTFNRIKQQTA